MSRKSNKNGFVGIIAFIVIIFIVIGFISTMSWLSILIILLAAGAAYEYITGKQKRQPQPSAPSPLASDVHNDIRIAEDCVNILNTSTNLTTVISRYNDLILALERLCEYENNSSVSFPNERPSATLARIKSEKADIMNHAIQRAYNDMLQKCAALKTENGRKNRQIKFFDELNDLMPNFPPATSDFVIQFINDHINDALTDKDITQ